MTTEQASTIDGRSTLVNVIAWLLIVTSALSLLLSVAFVFKFPNLRGSIPTWFHSGESIFLLIIGVSLMRRRNWARLAIMVILVLTIIQAGVGILFFPESPTWASYMPLLPEIHVASAPGPVVFKVFMFFVGLTLLSVILSAWALLALHSESVRKEFLDAP